MTWFYFPQRGMYELDGVAEKELVSTGAHGYGTEAAAQANPNAPADAEQSLLLHTFDVAAGAPIGAAGISGVLQAPHGLGGVQGAVAKGAGAVADAFKKVIGSGFGLVFGNTTGLLGRTLKIIFGGVLIITGFLHMTGNADAVKGALAAIPYAGPIASKAVLPA